MVERQYHYRNVISGWVDLYITVSQNIERVRSNNRCAEISTRHDEDS